MFSVFLFAYLSYIETTETNRAVSKQTKTTLHFQKNTKICPLSNCQTVSVGLLFDLVQSKHRNSLFWYRTETNCFKTNRNKPKQTETNQNKTKHPKFSEKNPKMCSLSHCFGCSSVCFSSIEILKLSVLVQNRNNRNWFWLQFCLFRIETSFEWTP